MTGADVRSSRKSALDLVVVGEINPDIVVSAVDPTPAFGQVERIVDAITLTIGSSSVIMASAAARLGLRVAMVGVVGDDALGAFMLEAMRGRGLDVDNVRIDPSAPTGASVILAGRNDRAIMTALGTIGAVRAADVTQSLLERARHVHVGSYFLLDALRPEIGELFHAAHAAGATTSLDPNWDPSGAWDGGIRDVVAKVDVFLPNAEEAMRIAAWPELVDAARHFARDGRIVAVKDGANGGVAFDAAGAVVRVPAPAVETVDTIGAGDAFDAGFVAGWLDGRPLKDALALAVACGTLSTRAVGGVDGQPMLAEAQALAGSIP